MKIAVITPFFDEPVESIQTCIDTVANQTHTDILHIFVGDGRSLPKDQLRVPENLVSITLPSGCEDTGATPRAIGSLFAISQHCEGIAYLDADNTWDCSHLADAITCHENGADVVHSDRWICHHTTRDRLFIDRKDSSKVMIDTNTLSLFGSALPFAVDWWNVPRKKGVRTAGVDRYFVLALLDKHEKGDIKIGRTKKPTVNYRSRWTDHYSDLETNPPNPAKIVKEENGVISAHWVYPVRRNPDGSWNYSPSNPEGYNSINVPFDRHLMVLGSESARSLATIISDHREICASNQFYPDFFVCAEGPPASKEEFDNQWQFESDNHRYALSYSQDYLLSKNAPAGAANIFTLGLRPKFVVVLDDPIKEIESILSRLPTDDKGQKIDARLFTIYGYFTVLRNLHRYYPAEDILILTPQELSATETAAGKVSQFLGLDIKLDRMESGLQIGQGGNAKLSGGDLSQLKQQLSEPMQLIREKYGVAVDQWGF